MKKLKILGKTCTGRIELGDGTTILAGVNGIGTAATDIRFWSGSTFANRTTAPFRVQQDGKVYATSGAIGGWNLATDAIYTGTKSTASGFSTSGVTFGSDGSIHSPRFYVNADGSVGIRSSSNTEYGPRIEINSTDNQIVAYSGAAPGVRIGSDVISSNPGVAIYNPTNALTKVEVSHGDISQYIAGTKVMQLSAGVIMMSSMPTGGSNLKAVYYSTSDGKFYRAT